MAKCGNCRSTDVLACAEDNVSCVNCGHTGPNVAATAPLVQDAPAKKTAPPKKATK